jgi:hypothetical protein
MAAQARNGSSAAGRGLLASAVLLAMLLGGCSFERAFCGTGSLICEADVSFAKPR